jgi:NAD(P)-dependent dehydrogenase (short-subunit alcohol dehydrogenase family)
MDLGLSGKKAVVCAASKGLGRAVAVVLADEGVNLVINARNQEALETTAENIRIATGVTVVPIAADITTEAGREAVLTACPNPDILLNNAGGPPPGDFRDVNREDWIRAFDANMLAPILLIRAVVDGMIDWRFGRIVNITTSGVKSPGTYPQLGVSIGVRSGLTGFIGYCHGRSFAITSPSMACYLAASKQIVGAERSNLRQQQSGARWKNRQCWRETRFRRDDLADRKSSALLWRFFVAPRRVTQPGKTS